jgi:ankyrin repeat protein
MEGPLGDLRAAILGADASRVAALLEPPGLRSHLNDGDPDFHFGATPLILAVGRKHREMIDRLLQAGADINARSNWWAGSFGILDDCDPDLADFLIERGATVTPHAAARLGMLDRLREILDADPGAVHGRGGDGQTPLHFASTVDVADLLLDRGADPNALDVDHESTPAQWMARERQEVARRIIERGGQTDLLLAAALGLTDRVVRHLDDDPASIGMSVTADQFPMKDPRAGGKIYIWTMGWNKTPHLVAHEHGHADVFRLLMDRSSPELRLSMACAVGDEALVRQLPRVPVQSEARRLVDAAEDENLAAVRLFLRAGWPTGARGQHNMTALQWAAFHGNLALAETLIAAGADVNLGGDDFNCPPLCGAIYGSRHGWRCKTGNYPAVVEALLKAGATPPPKIPDHATDAVREVLKKGTA